MLNVSDLLETTNNRNKYDCLLKKFMYRLICHWSNQKFLKIGKVSFFFIIKVEYFELE